jgi:hypothetical protein
MPQEHFLKVYRIGIKMKRASLIFFTAVLLAVVPGQRTWADQTDKGRPSFKKVMIVILENKDYQEAMDQPFMSKLAQEGANLIRFYAETHPSLPNYIALTSGGLHGINSNSSEIIDVSHIGNLLEAKGMTWKVYAEGFPGDCFTGAKKGNYVRKHVPFLSYRNVVGNPARCSKIVEASQLQRDIKEGGLPDYALFIPDLQNSGHDASLEHVDRWLGQTFGPLLQNPRFMKDMLLVVTFDEGSRSKDNHIYTVLLGDSVKAGSVSNVTYNHYSLLRTIENAFGLGTLGRKDADAVPITEIWK